MDNSKTNSENNKKSNDQIPKGKDQLFYDIKEDSVNLSQNAEKTLIFEKPQKALTLQTDNDDTKKKLQVVQTQSEITKTLQIGQQNNMIQQQQQQQQQQYQPEQQKSQQLDQQQQQQLDQQQSQQGQEYQQQYQKEQQLNQQQSQQEQEYKELIANLIQSKSSKIELNKKQAAQSIIFFQNPQKDPKQDQNDSLLLKDKFETEFRELFLKLEHQKQIINPLQLVINQNIDINNIEVLFYVLSDQMKRANRLFFKSNQPNETLMYSFQGQFTADSKDSQAYSLTLQETSDLMYNKIASNEYLRQNFINQLTRALAIDLNVQENQIQMVALEKGSIKVIFEIIDPSGAVHSSENFTELQKLYPGTSPQLQLHDYFKIAALSVNDFDPKHDMIWDHFHFGNYGQRGPKGNTQPYFYPIGWKGYGLRVSQKYGNNINWLMMNQNSEEWYVMFHGTKFESVKSIVQNGFKAGDKQAYQNCICKLTNKVIGKGVYFSNHIEVCDRYAEPTQIGNHYFKLIFQSRVKPEALRQCKKTSNLTNLINKYKQKNKVYDPSLDDEKLWNDDYFVINNTCDIRPYRILLKEYKKR